MLSTGGSDLPPSPPESPPASPRDHNNDSSSDMESDPDMGDHDQGNPNVDRPWLKRGAVAVPRLQHNLPKHPDKLLQREIPMAWGTTTNILTPEINHFQYAREIKYLTLKDQNSYLILDG